ncbi:MBL fold metallo-hydrolase [Comamonas endophytica]|uniref:MBL fold metallo-hydrolase n=1 Tax=Comamonas endophytica TaxID=2949090 RepID=A0ABY6G844_9BURK|nr:MULTISPECIES: MBL fold metallo-hydrolase [unclassified Acidovorax]MCD2511142.1 MBL fold metallo-hydrolase [Acidovorax sp. D4N7]UYG50545.1 MBL fold metallo-hydrolase [Acidovorax sp. 5MLIR]
MQRPSQLLRPQRSPVEPRPAATVLLLRDQGAGGGIEVLMTRRSPHASFLPGAYVFPGGSVDALDALSHGAAARRPTQGDAHLTQAIAAIRESFEELGVLLARHADGRMADAADIAALDRDAPFVAQCTARGLTLAADELHALAHWTGDRTMPKRFATQFLVARMPAGQTPVADEREQFEPQWITPAEALQRHAQGVFPIIFPTMKTLEKLARFESVDALFAALAHEEVLWECCPRTGLIGGKERRHMEDEAAYGELEMVSPDGQVFHPLDWQSAQPVQLRRNVLRLTAPNAGMMTGPGTNSYLVGEPLTGYIAIDPGPSDPEHVRRLFDAAGGDIRHIVCTHSHADHSPGAALLQALQVQDGRAPAAVRGLPSAPTARAASRFLPDQPLVDGERLALAGTGAEGPVSHTLQAVFTPGHAANHMCFLLEEDALLFSGDHILNGSTTVIDPPDGNMADYLDSLAKLDALCAQHGVEFILPAHGYVLGRARQVIARLQAHRLAREAKVARAMQAAPDGTPEDWVRLAYSDAPPALWPVAQRSLLAHVERIRALGLRDVSN